MTRLQGDRGTPRETRGHPRRGTAAGTRGPKARRSRFDSLRLSRAAPASASPLPQDDGGALLLLAGFILGVALIVTGLTLSEVAQLESEAVREQDASFVAEYRSIRDKIGEALADSVTTSTTTTVFSGTFDNIAENFEQLENARGYAFMAILSGGESPNAVPPPCSTSLAETSECELTSTTVASCPGTRVYKDDLVYSDGSGAGIEIECQDYDGVDDGILVDEGARIRAAYVYLRLDDPALVVEELVLYELNG